MLRKIGKFIFVTGLIILISSYASADMNILSVSEFSEQKSLEFLKKKINSKETVDIVDDFCNIMLDEKSNIYYDSANDFYYSPNQSLFMYFLCKNVNNNFSSRFQQLFATGNNGYLKISTFPQLGLVSIFDTGFATKDVSKLYNSLINDYTNFKQASMYGLFTDTKDDYQKFIDEYATNTFFMKFENTTFETFFPKTNKVIKSYYDQISMLLTNSWILNPKNLYKDYVVNQKDCSIQDTNKNYNIVMCGLVGSKANIIKSFDNVLYNEQLFYRLFLTYYQDRDETLQYLYYNADKEKLYNILVKQGLLFKDQIYRSKKAMSMSMRMINDMKMSYDYHIGMLMYQELLDGFRSDFAPVVTPIFSLLRKFNNVQEKVK